jgi:hypothetical protein
MIIIKYPEYFEDLMDDLWEDEYFDYYYFLFLYPESKMGDIIIQEFDFFISKMIFLLINNKTDII